MLGAERIRHSPQPDFSLTSQNTAGASVGGRLRTKPHLDMWPPSRTAAEYRRSRRIRCESGEPAFVHPRRRPRSRARRRCGRENSEAGPGPILRGSLRFHPGSHSDICWEWQLTSRMWRRKNWKRARRRRCRLRNPVRRRHSCLNRYFGLVLREPSESSPRILPSSRLRPSGP